MQDKQDAFPVLKAEGKGQQPAPPATHLHPEEPQLLLQKFQVIKGLSIQPLHTASCRVIRCLRAESFLSLR